MKVKTIAERIKTAMIVYANYISQVEKCATLEYDSSEYRAAAHSREFYSKWLTEELNVLKALGIDVDITF